MQRGKFRKYTGARPPGRKKAVVFSRVDVIECCIGAERIPGSLDPVVPARLLLMKDREELLLRRRGNRDCNALLAHPEQAVLRLRSRAVAR